MKRIVVVLFTAFVFCNVYPQKNSFIFLGDIHYDRMEDHDQEWLSKKPDDLRQVKEYTAFTQLNWNDFMSVLREKIKRNRPPVKFVVQGGDLSEGLAGTPEKAAVMAKGAIDAIENASLGVPWIIAKGNHDITGPGAVEAFNNIYLPEIRKQTGNPDIKNASYSYRYGNIQITCVDPWDRNTEMIAFLEKELSTNAKFKFIVIHEPVIPVTERCWHVLRREPDQREKLLNVIARNKAIVLCAHLHRYSVVSRSTDYGPVVQVMAISVINDRNYIRPEKLITEYGPSLAEAHPEWEPATMEARKKMLSDEAAFVKYYKQTDLPGYALIRIDENKGRVILDYYPAFGKKPYDSVDLSALLYN